MAKYLSTLLLFLSIYFVNAQECGIVYVSPTGASSGAAGTRANPASLSYGLTLFSPANSIVRLQAGTYTITNTLDIPSGITIEGGFTGPLWTKSNATPSIISRTNANPQTNPGRLIGLSCVNIADFNLLDISVEVADATGNGVSVYGIYVSGCLNYIISRCQVQTGKGSNGLPGLPGAGGLAGAPGTNGQSGDEEGNCCRQPGVGGSGSFVGSFPGGNGGFGASRGAFDIDTNNIPFVGIVYNACCDFSNNGPPGQSGNGPGAGAGGPGGQKLCNLTYANGSCSADITNAGGVGSNGGNGINGLPGINGLASHTGGFYVPGNGGVGQAGLTHGAGAGGGGGGGAKGCEPAVIDPLDGDTVYYTSGSGGAGAGGGEGGQLAQGGSGGSGGGGSFCIYITSNGVNGTVQDCFLQPGISGLGGSGGLGGLGGSGGLGGLGGTTNENGVGNSCNVGKGGNGGVGGSGGNGGVGGNGSNGISIGLYQDPQGLPVLNPNSFSQFAPTITATYTGCTRSDVLFTTTATGLVNWIFGFAANPLQSETTTDTVKYSGQGLRSITLIVDGVPYNYPNFVNIDDLFTPPAIQASGTTVCVGSSLNFSTPATANSYSWTFNGGSPATSSVQNAGSVTFSTPGTYSVKLETTSCCGLADTSITINVINSVQVALGPDTSICFTDPLPVLNAGNPGATYTWTLNGTPIGGATSQTLLTNAPGNYAVNVSFGTGCAGSDSRELTILTALPVNLGTDTTAVCIGQPLPLLDAGIANSTYQWRLNNNPIGTSTQTLQATLPGEYSVFVTSPTGCLGADTTQLLISDPEIDLGFDVAACANDLLPLLDAQNPGTPTYVWTLNGNPIGGNTRFLQTTLAGEYEVNIVNQFGCAAQDSFNLTLNPTIQAQVICPPSVVLNQSVNFTDQSTPTPSAWLWNFGDDTPATTTQNPSHAFTSVGQREVFMVASNGLCADTALCTVDVQYDCNLLALNGNFNIIGNPVDLFGLGYAEFENLSSPEATQFIWNFGDNQTSTLENPVHLYTAVGDYTVTLTVIAYNCTTTVTQPVTVINTEGLNVAENPIADIKALLYPNPANQQLNVVFTQTLPQAATLILTNLQGQTIASYPLPNKQNTLPIAQLPTGLYLYTINYQNQPLRFGKLVVDKIN